MAETKTIKARTLQKRDTSANWTKANPIILNGETIIVETESGELRKKIGDGVKKYTELPFDDEVIRGLINDNKQKIEFHTIDDYRHISIAPAKGVSRRQVLLLLPTLTETNFIGNNALFGTFIFYRKGALKLWSVDIKMACTYGVLKYNIEQVSDSTNGDYVGKLCVCKYNGIEYYAIDLPCYIKAAGDMGYESAIFSGYVNTELQAPDMFKCIAYYSTSAEEALNSEINDSIVFDDWKTTTLATRVFVHPTVFSSPVYVPVGNSTVSVSAHIGGSIVSDDGIHGFRYNIKNEAFEVFSDNANEWVNLDEAGSIGEPLSASLVDFDIVRSFSSVYIMWKEPDYSECSADWGSTIIVRKEGGIPENPKDGVVVYETTGESDFNAYSEQPYMDPEIIDYTKTYGYRIFPKSTAGVYNKNFNFGKLLSPIKPNDVSHSPFINGYNFPDPFSVQVYLQGSPNTPQSISCDGKTVTVEKYQWGKTTLIWSVDGFKTPESGGGMGSISYTQQDQYFGEPFTITELDPDTDYYLTVTAEDWRGVKFPPDDDWLWKDKIHTTKIDPTLGRNRWSVISLISQRGEASNYWSVGDCVSVDLNINPDITHIGTLETINLWSLYAYILGFNHNQFQEGAGITFGCFKADAGIGGNGVGVDVCLCDSYYGKTTSDGTKAFNMNHWATGSYNSGGWAGCDLRYDILGSTDTPPDNYGTSTMTDKNGHDASSTTATNPVPGTLMAALPEDLRQVMKPITKYTESGLTFSTYTVVKTVDYLPLLSVQEITGSTTRGMANHQDAEYQVQYAYYAVGNPRQKYKFSSQTDEAEWLTRSRSTLGPGTYFCTIDEDGNSDLSISSCGLAPIFLV